MALNDPFGALTICWHIQSYLTCFSFCLLQSFTEISDNNVLVIHHVTASVCTRKLPANTSELTFFGLLWWGGADDIV